LCAAESSEIRYSGGKSAMKTAERPLDDRVLDPQGLSEHAFAVMQPRTKRKKLVLSCP
jgi:hypothetical protein